jgi:hypothetical protein
VRDAHQRDYKWVAARAVGRRGVVRINGRRRRVQASVAQPIAATASTAAPR